MTSMSTDAAHPQNGVSSATQLQADFFAKLASFETSVLNQQHPRFKFPSKEVQKLASSLKSSSLSSPVRHDSSANTNGNQARHVVSESLPPAAQQQTVSAPLNTSPSQPSSASKAVHAKTSSTAFDPVLLTKSSDLIRAEINLKRLRIERALQESSSNIRSSDSTRDKELGLWVGPLAFDVTQVLEASRSIVKPFSGLQTPKVNEVSSANSSFDENSYYSSKGNSWSPSVHEAQATDGKFSSSSKRSEQNVQLDSQHDGPVSTVREPRISGLGPQQDANTAANTQRHAYPQPENPQPENKSSIPEPLPSQPTQTPVKDSDVQREESYSPPEAADEYEPPPAEQFVAPSTEQDTALTSHREPSESAQQAQHQRPRESESYSPPPPPAQALQEEDSAEQPQPALLLPAQHSTISPTMLNSLQQALVTGHPTTQPSSQNDAQTNKPKSKKKDKVTRIKEAKKLQGEAEQQSRRASGNQASLNPRKRRREIDDSDESQHRAAGHRYPQRDRTRRSVSPLPYVTPYVKPEPLSPPPPSGEPPRRLVLRQDGLADIEVSSPQRPIPSRPPGSGLNDAGRSARRVAQYDPRYPALDPIVLDDSDAPLRTVRRKRAQEDGNLRRLASLQHASHPYTHGHPSPLYNVDDPYSVRPVSQIDFDRPRYQPYENEQNRQVSLHARSYDRRSSPFIYSNSQTTPQMPPPPPPPPVPPLSAMGHTPRRRILVDEYGNEYIAVPTRPDVHQPSVREFGEDSPQYLRQPLYEQNFEMDSRTGNKRKRTRLEPQVIEIDDDDDDDTEDYQPMPPPPIIPRQRHVGSRDDATLMQPQQYPYYPSNRAVSLQPHPHLGSDPQRYMPYAPNPWPVQNTAISGRERAFSARPSFATMDDYYQSNMGPPAWRRM